MDWLTAIWCMAALACLTLALAYFVVWLQDRYNRVHLLFALAALGVAGVAAGESLMLVHAGVISWPYMIGFALLVPVAAIAYELGADVARSGQLRRELERRQAELRESEQQMELAATAAGLGLWRWDIAANRVWANHQGRPLLGLNGDEYFDLDHFLDRLVPQDRDSVRQAVMHSLDDGSDFESEYRLRLHDGSTRWIAARGRVEFNGDATPVVMRGVAFDITERRNADREQARQRNELAHLARVTMLGELSGSLAHELNQPLTAILSNAQAAQEFLAAPSVDLNEVRDILQDIVAEDRRAGEVIRRLRLLFRKGEVRYDSLDLNELVLDVLTLMNSELVNSSVTVQMNLAPALPHVSGDRVQLQQILINLIVNASDAMADTPVAERRLRISTMLDENDQVHLRVADTGCGIPPGKLEQVFEPFHTTKAAGMGLGLAVCRTIISAHGGKLWASHNPDRGACFHVTLSPSG